MNPFEELIAQTTENEMTRSQSFGKIISKIIIIFIYPLKIVPTQDRYYFNRKQRFLVYRMPLKVILLVWRIF
jgi:hypothetical protein